MAKKNSSIARSDINLKVLIIIALIASFVGGYLVARAKYKPQIVELYKMVKDKDTALMQMKSQTNKIMMEEGSMWIIEDSEKREMEEDLLLTSGDKVSVDGKVVKKDGTEMMLQNGDSIDMNGIVKHAGSEKEE